MNDGLNYEAWARNAIAFIRERGLEGEFSDWCGGWPVPVKATAPMIAAAPLLLEALEKAVAYYDGLSRPHDDGEAALLDSLTAAISTARGGQ